MKRKFISILLVLVLSFSLMTALPVAAQTDRLVPSQYGTIQTAIDAADPGDTIIVSDGTYTEDLTVNTVNLTLRSLNGKAVTIIQLVDSVGIDLMGGSDNFTLGGASGQGFTISPHATATTFDIQLTNAPSDVEISYSTIDTTGSASMGISVGAAGASGFTISNNTFTAEAGDGSIWGPKIVNVTVSNNTFTGPGSTTSGYAVEFAGVTGTSTISGNTISGYGMGVAIFHGEGTSGLTISGNTISGSNNGIRLGQYSPTTDGDMTTVTVTQNTLTNNTIALRISSGANVKASQFTVNNNNISGSSTFGLQNQSSETVTAEDNWWGDASGPTHASNSLGTGDTVSDNVDFIPWLNAAYPGGQPAGLVMNITQSTAHTTIQEAIDAASAGDTIVAKDAIYTEDLTVNIANLTLRSLNGKAVTIIQLVDGVGIDLMGGSDNFTLGGASGQGFTISPHATATTFDIQLTNAPSDVEISYSTIDTTGSASMGISVGAAGASGFTISNNTFTADSGDGSIWGPNVVNVTVSNNTLSGGSYGVQFSGVAGTSTISNNIITGYTGSGGIVISNGAGTSGLTITGNTIISSSNGIYFVQYTAQGTPADMTTVTVTYNTISGSTNDAIKIGDGTNVKASNFTIMYNAFINSTSYGLENLHSTEQVTAENNWWNDVAGPNHAKNPYNTNSTGDDVTNNVDYTPWMIHTSLVSGWNIYSTPITSGTATDTVSEALDFWGSDTSLLTAAYYYDASSNNWVQPTLGVDDDLTPQVPFYLNMSGAAAIDVLMSTSNTAPPAMTMYQGWNLVGPAQMYPMTEVSAMISAYQATGQANLVGYTQIISPSIGNQVAAWTYIRDVTTANNMLPTEGYWVYMANQGTLGGFTYTPITPLP